MVLPGSARKLLNSSAMRLVKVVISTRSFCFFLLRISLIKSVICPSDDRTSTSGSTKPVGLINCSTIFFLDLSISHCCGVAERNKDWGILGQNSSALSGRLSKAEGIRKPKSISVCFRDLSPRYIPLICGTVIWDSSITTRKSSPYSFLK